MRCLDGWVAVGSECVMCPEETSSDGSMLTCTPHCAPGFFATLWNGEPKCFECPTENTMPTAACFGGSEIPRPLEGYWSRRNVHEGSGKEYS